MADVRVDRPAYVPSVGVPGASEDRPRQQRREGDLREGGSDGRPGGGREELAVAFDDPGRSLAALFEEAEDGTPRVRIVDRTTGHTVAVVSPDELRAMAEQTGLPSGLLFQART
ncbi:MAG: hypothetical protein M0R73_06140 [Dehalococcoidia bacterium]|nr:hypothetical protein [Dehalococcoidia bacterium]